MIRPDISIVIVNYNVRDFLVNCLDSLLESLDNLAYEIFVVDNASTDDSVKVIRELFPNVKLILNNSNVGFAKANNLALKDANGKYLLLLNPDTIIGGDAISEGLKFFYENPDASIIGSKTLNADGTLQIACRRSFPTPWISFCRFSGLSLIFPNSKIFGKYNLKYLDPDKSYQIEAISGSFMMFRREVYDDIGGLDEDFFMYGEDLDWLYRAYKRGWKTFYVPSVKIIHYKGESTRRSKINAADKFYGAMHLFVKKHYRSFISIFILRLGIFIKSVSSVVLDWIALSLFDKVKKSGENEIKRTLIVGFSERDKKYHELYSRELHQLVGCLSDSPELKSGLKVLGGLADLDEILAKYNIRNVYFSSNTLSYKTIINLIAFCRFKKAEFKVLPRY